MIYYDINMCSSRPDVFKQQISIYLEGTIYKCCNPTTQRDLNLLIINSIEVCK